MQLYVSSSHFPENSLTPPPSQDRKVHFSMDHDELADADRFAGMGATTELINGKPEGDLETFLSLQEAMSGGADQLQSVSNALIELKVPEVTLLSRLVRRGMFAEVLARRVPLSKLHEGEDGGLPLEALAINHGLHVAQSIAWLGLKEATENFDLYNRFPASPMLRVGLNPPASEDATHPALRPIRLVSVSA